PEVQTKNEMKILRALRKQYLRGVSIGYDYRREDCSVTQDENGKQIVTVKSWILREISITPTPADLSAQVRSRSELWSKRIFAEMHATKIVSMGAFRGAGAPRVTEP